MKGIVIPLSISAIILSTVLVAGQIDSGMEEPTIYDEWKKFNLITLAYLIDISNWSSMTCDEKRDHLEMNKILTMKERIGSELPDSPFNWKYAECVEMEK